MIYGKDMCICKEKLKNKGHYYYGYKLDCMCLKSIQPGLSVKESNKSPAGLRCKLLTIFQVLRADILLDMYAEEHEQELTDEEVNVLGIYTPR